ncbi:hypothetical protein PAESOLCIP111_01258 [Paenibacillus solanacearum]|uniref:LamG-like jellyroll fold domain-containing protein n=1 Tax=Paenibacillus solanacearum TaxID=2048548 RepID=A0A916JY92_9BACL|nr:sialidase family protein [Paenibacillus solanacearum]CAG7610578.1 hypothetical protein PAESOLCIP111_01258 [Paenibacillus solanacearum]
MKLQFRNMKKHLLVLTFLAGMIASLYNDQSVWSQKRPDKPVDPGNQAERYDSAFSQTLVSQIDFSDASTQVYLGSPSIVRVDGNTLLASHDYFGPNDPSQKTSVFRSEDNGLSWVKVALLDQMYYGKLFMHEGSVYLFGVSGKPFKSIVIRKSIDRGSTWTTPSDSKSGLLFTANGTNGTDGYQTAPTSVIIANGRIYRAFEAAGPPYEWPKHFKAMVVSAPANADLLDAANWTKTNELAYNPAWTPASWNSTKPGWLEGNIVQAPSGEMWNVLRMNSTPISGKAANVKLSADNRSVSFDPATGFIDFPGGMSKFTLLYDEASGTYLSLVNNNTAPSKADQRNVLSLYFSADLVHWNHVRKLISDDSGLSLQNSIAKVGFQYVDWQIDGDDIIYAVRTSYDGADTYHNSNRITFHRFKNFRSYMDPPRGAWSFNEASGSLVSDSSRFGVTGTVYGATRTSSYLGGGLSFNGEDQYVGLGNQLKSALNHASAVTITGWINNRSLPAGGAEGGWLFATNAADNKAGAEVLLRGNHIRVGGRSGAGENYEYKDYPYTSTAQWHHVAGIIDYKNNSIQLYIDGVPQTPAKDRKITFGSQAYHPGSSQQPDTIGKSPANGGFFDGLIDEVKVYGRALSPNEINELAYDGLKGYWKFNEGSGTTAPDSSDSELDGKIMGASWLSGKQGQGLRFDGNVDYVDLDYKMGAALNGSPSIAFSGWINERVLAGTGGRTLFGTRINGATAGYELVVLSNSIRVAGRSTPADPYSTKDFAYQPSGTWRHIVGILDFKGNNIRLYVDGVEQQPIGGSVSFSRNVYERFLPTQPDAIGRSPGGTSYFTGMMDHVMIFGKTLTSLEVEHLYQQQKINHRIGSLEE